MKSWEIKLHPRMAKALKTIKGNAPAQHQLAIFTNDLQAGKDPSTLGERKRGPYRNCFGLHLTKSISLIYNVEHHARIVHFINLGDHKQLYGRDNRQ